MPPNTPPPPFPPYQEGQPLSQPQEPATPPWVTQSGYPPAYAPPPTPMPPARPGWRERLTTRNALIGCGAAGAVLLVACLGCALLINASGGLSSVSTAPTATTAPTTPPRPTATRDPNAGWQDYVNAVLPDTQTLSNDLAAIGKDCGAQDLTRCDADAHLLAADVESAQQTVNQHPAPPCLKAVDTQYRTVLVDLANTARELYTGIENNDVSQIQAATNDMYRAVSAMNKATHTLGTVVCA